jgi:signal transduction histidine kinase
MFSIIFETKKMNKNGTGLGLFICKQLSKELTFENDTGIQIKSEFGKGSKFYFLLENKKIINKNLHNIP